MQDYILHDETFLCRRQPKLARVTAKLAGLPNKARHTSVVAATGYFLLNSVLLYELVRLYGMSK